MFNLNDGLLIYLLADNVKAFNIANYVCMFFCLVIAYFLGSINSAIIVSKLLCHDDVRKHGSGNPGLTNMLRTFGKAPAGLTLLGDLLKTAIAVCITGVFFGFHYINGISDGDGYCYAAGLFAVIGHVFTVYYKCKGGKGVLSTAVMALILTPIPALILILIFAGIVAASKYVSLGSVTSAILYPIIVNGYFNIVLHGQTPGLISLSTILLAILIVWCHRENLKRISERTERKISIGGKKKKDESDAE
jgi:glycerol-3-phosphate acyltransferase PlsY